MFRYSNGLLATLCLGLAFLHGVLLYSGSTGNDDVYITYWSAKTLSDGGHIVNYNGDALEQSSSLLHVIILAILHKLSGISFAVLGIYLSAFMGGMTLIVAWRLAGALQLKYPWFVIFFCAVFPYLVYWSFAGLETTLVTLLVTLLVYAVIKISTQTTQSLFHLFTSLLIGCYLLARPEAIFIILLFFLEIAGYMLIYNQFKQQHPFTYTTAHYISLTQLFSVTLILFIVLSFWRYQTFGQIFPQPVYAKSAGLLLSNFLAGIEYLFQQYWIPSLAVLTGLVVGGTAQIFRGRVQDPREPALVIILLFFLAQMAFVVAKGDDWMEGGRFFVPVLPLLVIYGLYVINQFPVKIAPLILILLSLTAWIDNAKFNKYQSRGTFLPLIKAVSEPVINHFEALQTNFDWPEKINREHLAHIPSIIMLDKVITQLLKIKSSLTIFAWEMGMIPFYIADQHFGKVKFIDMYGLTTHHLTYCDLEKHFNKSFGGHLFKGRFGIQTSLWFLLAKFKEIQENCPIIPDPDIIYGMGEAQWINNLDESKGKYQIIYRQSGQVTTGGCWSKQKANADYFIIISANLLAKTNEFQLESYKWPQVSCQMRRTW
ncbi:MAG: hypothetical protein HC877_13750 [Thioploca sp.]|nr:hypothetical protein [Thioploca sp.]